MTTGEGLRRDLKAFAAGTAALALLAVCALTAPRASAATAEGAVISNGTIALGVTELGSLNYDCEGASDPTCLPPSFEGTRVVGLRFLGLPDAGPGGLASTEPGCLCEGWGAADAGTGLTGYANESEGDENVVSESITSPSPDRAVATVNIADPAIPGATMRVVQDYRPSAASPFVYINTVTITNTGSTAFTDLRYRRVMDWDTEPTAFDEYVTSKGTSAQLLFNSDDGFAESDPLEPRTYINSETVCGPDYTGVCEFTDLGSGGLFANGAGPDDIGGLYDFGFGALAPGESKSFSVLYGAAPSEAQAIEALNRVGAQIYSLGQSSCEGETIPDCSTGSGDAGPLLGKPATFMFAFVTASSDLSIRKDGPDKNPAVGEKFRWDLTVTNNGPDESRGVQVTDQLPEGVKFDSATADPGSCTLSGTDTVVCDIGNLASGARAEIRISVTAQKAGKVRNTATVSSVSEDKVADNNSDSATTTIGGKAKQCPGIEVDGKVVFGTEGKNNLSGSGRNDHLLTKGGNDSARGKGGDDCLIGQAGADKLTGSSGDDTIRGGKDNDQVSGGAGDDDIKLQNGNDTASGGSGDDRIKAQARGVDRVDCGSGNDVVIASDKDKVARDCEKIKVT